MLVITRRTNKTDDHKWVDIPGIGSICITQVAGNSVRIGFEGFDGYKIFRREFLKRAIDSEMRNAIEEVKQHDGKLEGVDAGEEGGAQPAPTETGDGVSADSGGD